MWDASDKENKTLSNNQEVEVACHDHHAHPFHGVVEEWDDHPVVLLFQGQEEMGDHQAWDCHPSRRGEVIENLLALGHLVWDHLVHVEGHRDLDQGREVKAEQPHHLVEEERVSHQGLVYLEGRGHHLVRDHRVQEIHLGREDRLAKVGGRHPVQGEEQHLVQEAGRRHAQVEGLLQEVHRHRHPFSSRP